MTETKKSKADIARENGAKSKGPITQEGAAHRPGAASEPSTPSPQAAPHPSPSCANSPSDRSRANALNHGHRAETLKHLAQPHPAVLCNEDPRAYFALLANLVANFKPAGPAALDVVRDLAVARWELSRAQQLKSAALNRAFLLEAQVPHNLPPELINIECALNAALQLSKITAAFDRTIDRLITRAARLERRLRFLHACFPYERTNDVSPQPVENTEQAPLITDDASELTRDVYAHFFPGRDLHVIATTEEPVQ